jgi:hypothetical protein
VRGFAVRRLAVGIAVLASFDRSFEARAVDASPTWPTELATRF